MAEVTYHFNSRFTGNWTDPDYMIDGILTNFAYTAQSSTSEALDGNTCPGTDLGTITKVEFRVYGYGDGDDRIDVRPWTVTIYKNVMPSSPGWGIYHDITNDIEAPDWSLWSQIQGLAFWATFNAVGKGNTMYCAKVEIRITYTPPEAEVGIENKSANMAAKMIAAGLI